MPNQTKPSLPPYRPTTRAASDEVQPKQTLQQRGATPVPLEPYRGVSQTQHESPPLVAQPYTGKATSKPQPTERGEQLVAQPYRPHQPQHYRQQMRRFAYDSPTDWITFSAEHVLMVLSPLLAGTVYLINAFLQVAFAIVELGAGFLSVDSQRRIRQLHSPMLHKDSPAAVLVLAALLLFGIGFVTKPFLLPTPADPRSFEYTERPAWQRLADPSRAVNFFGYALDTLRGKSEQPNNAAPAPAADQPLNTRAAGDYNLQGTPSISPAQIDRILESYGSPAAGTGQEWYDLGKKYNIDPAYAVAFFIHESSAGTNPVWAGWKDYNSQTSTHNVGNIICAGYATCYGRFRDYPSWEAGIDDWYRLIAVEYIEGRGTLTVAQIIPIYAPSFENNVDAYVGAVETMVDTWRTQGAP